MDESSIPRRMPEKCPSCGGELAITRLSCSNCPTEVSGRFHASRLERLKPEDQHFVLLFVLRKGNLKEMERDLGISYWTIRRRLDEIVEQLDRARTQPGGDNGESYEFTVVRQLKDGEIDAERALELLRAGRRRQE